MKLKKRILAMVLTICVAMSIPMSVVTAAPKAEPKAEPKATGTVEVLTTNASGDNGHLRLRQTAKRLDKQKTEAEVIFHLETDDQVIGTQKSQDIIFVVD